MLKHYPWERLKRGQGFFVPALDLDAVREAGLKAGVKQKVTHAMAVPCIRAGLLGILFYRQPYVRKQRSRS
jgi:hypothetical protein